jgi:hypothetical protein
MLSATPADHEKIFAFRRKTAEIQRILLGAGRSIDEALKQVKLLKKGCDQTANQTAVLYRRALELEQKLHDLNEVLYGDVTKQKRSEPALSGLFGRLSTTIYGYWRTSSPPTRTMVDQLEIVDRLLESFLSKLSTLLSVELKELFKEAKTAGIPWTPGRLPSE